MVSDSVLEHPDQGAATGEEDSQTEEEEEEEEEDEDGYVVYKAQKVNRVNFFQLLLSIFGTVFSLKDGTGVGKKCCFLFVHVYICVTAGTVLEILSVFLNYL
jgi:hypothetical protein